MTDGKPAMTEQTARHSEKAAADSEKNDPAGPAPDSALSEGGLAVQETAELKDKLLRALADMENLRRRTEREVADARLYGIAGFARDVLGIADNMHRALQAARQELQGTAEPGVNTLLEGVELIERELLKTLQKHGVTRFDPQGEKFDPHLHQAVFEVADESLPAGAVAQVIQPGYMIGERILRPALVAVAKGGPKATPGEEDTPPPDAA